MNRAFLYNVSANVMTFILMMLMSVCLTPYIVHTLGVEAFGLIHLTQNMINYLSVITASLSAVVVRFFLLRLIKERWNKRSAISLPILSVLSFYPSVFFTLSIHVSAAG